MSYTGALTRGNAVTLSTDPSLDNRHGEKKFPDSNWSAPPAPMSAVISTGDVDTDQVEIAMEGRGVQLDLGHRWGHAGTPKTRVARAPFRTQGAAQDASAAAHGDKSAAGYSSTYNPNPIPFAGERYGVDWAPGREGVARGARAIIHDRLGGQHVDGSGGTFQSTGYRLGVSRRWAGAFYRSPNLGAMYSAHTPRGVLPQTISTGTPQPAPGGAIYNSGLGSQERQRTADRFTIPRLFRLPPSWSDQVIAEQPTGEAMGPVI